MSRVSVLQAREPRLVLHFSVTQKREFSCIPDCFLDFARHMLPEREDVTATIVSLRHCHPSPLSAFTIVILLSPLSIFLACLLRALSCFGVLVVGWLEKQSAGIAVHSLNLTTTRYLLVLFLRVWSPHAFSARVSPYLA